MYADATASPVEKVNATFAGIFASSYLGLETLTKVLATAVFLTSKNPQVIIFSIYSAIAVVSCLVILSISELEE
jgi:hypothetical protein